MENQKEEFKYKFKGTGLGTKDKNKAHILFEEYRERHHIERFSDLGILEELCFAEILQERYKGMISKIERLSKEKNVKKVLEEGTVKQEEVKIPAYILGFLDNNLQKILTLKEKLGLFEDNRENDTFKYIERLKKKFKLWEEKNQESRQCVCPFCSKMFFLHIRTDKYQVSKSGFFEDKILKNEWLWKLFKAGKITKLDVAKVLLGKEATSVDYVDFLESKFYSNDSAITPSQ